MKNNILVITYALRSEIDTDKISVELANANYLYVWHELGPVGRFARKHFKNHHGKEVFLVCTGIGKTNSAIMLEEILYYILNRFGKHTSVEVLNIGTAASVSVPIGSLVECTKFTDRDLVSLGYGNREDYGLVSAAGMMKTDGWYRDFDEPRYCCHTGDSFVYSLDGIELAKDGYIDLFDMEAYAQAVVMKRVQRSSDMFDQPVRFRCVKYVSDQIGAEESGIECWEEELPAAAVSLTKVAIDAIGCFYS